MRRFVEAADRKQGTLFPDYLDDWVDENNPVQVIDACVDEVIWASWGSMGSLRRQPAGRPIIRPSC